MSWWILLLIGWALAGGLQLALWLLQLRTGSATAVDAGWAAALAGLPVLYAVLADGGAEHRVVAAVLPALAFGRVALVVAQRIAGEEDHRYRELRARWRARGQEQQRFFVFFQAQALLAVLLSVPFLAIAFNDADGLEALEWIGIVVWLAGAGFEAMGDRQLSRFRKNAENRGKVIDVGLWRYTRHPNYFGQWLTWCGYALVALAAPWGWIGLFAPALMLYLILFVTGLPPNEEHMLESRGDAYRDYQRRTSPFVPLPPRASA